MDTDLQFLKDIQRDRNTDKVNALAPRIRGQHPSQPRDKGRCEGVGGGVSALSNCVYDPNKRGSINLAAGGSVYLHVW